MKYGTRYVKRREGKEERKYRVRDAKRGEMKRERNFE